MSPLPLRHLFQTTGRFGISVQPLRVPLCFLVEDFWLPSVSEPSGRPADYTAKIQIAAVPPLRQPTCSTANSRRKARFWADTGSSATATQLSQLRRQSNMRSRPLDHQSSENPLRCQANPARILKSQRHDNIILDLRHVLGGASNFRLDEPHCAFQHFSARLSSIGLVHPRYADRSRSSGLAGRYSRGPQ